jgi:hypothetical protein
VSSRRITRDWWTALSNQLGSCTPASNATCAGAVNYDGWDDGTCLSDIVDRQI